MTSQSEASKQEEITAIFEESIRSDDLVSFRELLDAHGVVYIDSEIGMPHRRPALSCLAVILSRLDMLKEVVERKPGPWVAKPLMKRWLAAGWR